MSRTPDLHLKGHGKSLWTRFFAFRAQIIYPARSEQRCPQIKLTLALAGGSMRPPLIFLRCTPNYESDRAEILHSLWGILCAIFGEKKNGRFMLGHGAMTFQEVQCQAIFARNDRLFHIRRRYRPRRAFTLPF